MNLLEDVNFKVFTEEYLGYTATAAQLKAELAAADGDADAAIKAFADTSDDEKAAAFRERITQLTQTLKELKDAQNAYAAENAPATAKLSEDEVEAKTKELFAAQKGARDIKGSMEILVQHLGEEEQAKIKEFFTEHPVPIAPRTKTSTGITPRYPCTVTLSNNASDSKTTYDTIGAAAKVLGIKDTVELQKLVAKAGNVDHALLRTLDRPVDFTVPGQQEGLVWSVHVEPKETRRGGRPAASTAQPEASNATPNAEVSEEPTPDTV